jgi:vancomycin resistance protein YoaR
LGAIIEKVTGMTYEEASQNQELAAKAQQAYADFSYTFTVQGREFTYTAEQLGISPGLDGVLERAIAWGNVGSEKNEQKEQAAAGNVDFPAVWADRDAVDAQLQAHKPEYDSLPQGATLKLNDDPNATDKIQFVEAVDGIDVNVAQLAATVCDNINNGDFSVIEAPSIKTQAKLTAAELQANTTLMVSWYSEFNQSRALSDKDRVKNIKILAGLINGCVIQPYQSWSINDTAGPRNAQTARELGWTEAPGIENGRYSEQYGGGVCQVSSTVYNTAIRADLVIMQRKPHSWPSSYIIPGMDATISTDGPDLMIYNPYDYPVLIAATVDETAKKLTIDLYGPPLANGYTIDFFTQTVGHTVPPAPIYHYNAATDKDGNPIDQGKQVTWIEPRDGYVIKVFKQYKDANGNVVGQPEYFTTTTYKTYQGEYYCNFEDPLLATPTPGAS